MKTTHITFIISILLLIISVGGYIVLNHALSREKQHLVSLEQEVFEARRKATQEKALETFLVTAERVEEIEDYFVSVDDTVNFISKLEMLGRQVGVSVSITSVNITKSTDPLFESLSISLSSQGAYENVRTYSYLIEMLPYHKVVHSVSLTKEEDSEIWNGNISLEITKLKK